MGTVIDRNDLWLCDDCVMAAVNGDTTGLDYGYSEPEASEKLVAIEAGLTGLGPHLVPDFDSNAGDGVDEFSAAPCDCCRTSLAGGRHRFATLARTLKGQRYEHSRKTM